MKPFVTQGQSGTENLLGLGAHRKRRLTDATADAPKRASRYPTKVVAAFSTWALQLFYTKEDDTMTGKWAR